MQLRSCVESGIIGEFCQPLQGSQACIHLPVCQIFVDARWCGGNDTEKGELSSELIGSRDGLRQGVERCGSEVCREQKCRVRGGHSKPGAAIGVRPNGQDRTTCMTKDVFRDGAEEQLAYAVSSVCADDQEIRALLSDDLSQFRPQFTLPNDEFVRNSSKRSVLNQRLLQIRGIARYSLFTGSNCTRTRHGQTQGGHYMRQAKLRLIEPSECQRIV
jgi:hypothetical protein